MRIVLTTVKEAKVVIDDKTVGQIDRGYLLLVGFTQGDNQETVIKMVDKVLSLRVFPDENGKTNLSLQDVDGKILSVSQFTLYADVQKGRRPSFVSALHPDEATKLYDFFNDYVSQMVGYQIPRGVFGADMKVYSINDGPFTLLLDSKEILK